MAPYLLAAMAALMAVFVLSRSPSVPVPVSLLPPVFPSASPSPTPAPLPDPPVRATVSNDYHVFQSFNNCGPASLSMLLSYYGISRSQQDLGGILRPYQVAGGNNDDKSVTLEEIAAHATQYDLVPYHRPGGTIPVLKQFISHGFPVLARTWLKENEDIGHYRIIKGYDDTTGELIQDDSLQGKDLRYPYEGFLRLWEKFNYEFLVLVPPDKETDARIILGAAVDEKAAWQAALEQSQQIADRNPADTVSVFNVSVAAYHAGQYQASVDAYEQVADKLPLRTLWYQIEPVRAYMALGNYDRVLEVSDSILNNHNRAFSELYLMRGEIFEKQGNIALARDQYTKAVLYHAHMQQAKDALARLDGISGAPQ